MDGYALAVQASDQAVEALRALHRDGTVRVMQPLNGDFSLYAAVAGDTLAAVEQKLAAVRVVTGLGGVHTAAAVSPPSTVMPAGATPTWGAVVECVGFASAVVDDESLTRVYDTLARDGDVVGLAVLATANPNLLVEYTARTLVEFETFFARLKGMVGVEQVKTAVGECVSGFGLSGK